MRKGWEGIHYSNARNFYAAYGVESYDGNISKSMDCSWCGSHSCIAWYVVTLETKVGKNRPTRPFFFLSSTRRHGDKKKKKVMRWGVIKNFLSLFSVSCFSFFFDVIFARLPHDPSWSQRRRRNVKRKNFCFQWEKTWWSILSFLNIHLKTWVRRQWPCRKRKLLFRTRHKHFEVARKSGLN